MTTRKTVGKTRKKATLNVNWNSDNGNKRKTRKINKQYKKLSVGAIMIALVCLIVGSVGGVFAIKFITKNDCFILNGKDEITLQIGEKYIDDGAKVIAFGKDDADKVQVKTNLTKNENGTYSADEEGTYYIVYTVDNFKYGKLFKVQKIRLITFVNATEQEEIQDANQGGNS